MGRKAIPNAESKILKEVVSLSRTHSIRKISTIDIAYRMKVSETVIFKRFPTKEELLLGALTYSFRQIGEIDYTILLSDIPPKERKLDEFKKASDFMSTHILESNYITSYLLSEYFNLSDFEQIDGMDLMGIRNCYPSMKNEDFLIFIKQYFIALIAYANSKASGVKSDEFAFELMPEASK